MEMESNVSLPYTDLCCNGVGVRVSMEMRVYMRLYMFVCCAKQKCYGGFGFNNYK